MSTTDGTDPRIGELREQLTENDVKMIEAFNVRLELVARLKQVKEERGLDLIDPAREEWLLQHLASANRGPLSPEGLSEFYAGLLDLTKREVDLPRD
jgi:chorismate mutase